MPTSVEQVANKSFDYVICGGGTAGLTLAARLSEDSSVSVLVLEAGAEHLNDPLIVLPGASGRQFGNDSYCWNHLTIPQKHAGGRVVYFARGKCLGGTSALNFLSWTKPPAEEVDDIERLGNLGWNWKNYEKYIALIEGFSPPTEAQQARNNVKFDTDFSVWNLSRTGPIKIATLNEGGWKFKEALINAGLAEAPLPLSGDPCGAAFQPSNYEPDTNTRSYATDAYYLPHKGRPNLAVLTLAFVNRVITEDAADGSVTASGVEFMYSGKTHVVHALKDVILSTGTLKTPQILELSGIGRKAVLEKIQVPVKVELPGVGENLQEHIGFLMYFELRDDVPCHTIDSLFDPSKAEENAKLHALGRIQEDEAIIQAVKDKLNKDGASYPPGLLKQYKMHLERLERGAPECEYTLAPGLMACPVLAVPGKRYLTLLISSNHNFSRGTVHAVSNDPTQLPELDPHYLEEEIDLELLVEMGKFGRSLMDIPPLKDIITGTFYWDFADMDEKSQRESVVKFFTTVNHGAGICAMLPREDDGVVDPKLKVYGTTNIRVYDLSILPLQFASHPQASVYAFAEQAAAIIKGEL